MAATTRRTQGQNLLQEVSIMTQYEATCPTQVAETQRKSAPHERHSAPRQADQRPQDLAYPVNAIQELVLEWDGGGSSDSNGSSTIGLGVN